MTPSQIEARASARYRRRRSLGLRVVTVAAVLGLVGVVVLLILSTDPLRVVGNGGSSSLRRKPLPGPTHSTDPLATGTRVAIGVNSDGTPAPALAQFSQLAGARPRVVMWYQNWSQPFLQPDELDAAAAYGAVPMITWDPLLTSGGFPLSAITNGSYDNYIEASAQAAKSLGRRIYVRFAHEMNLHGEPYGPGNYGNTPQEFVAAWRHVVKIFRDEGATNAEFVWSPNVYCNGSCPFTKLYPGDSWVNWVSLDGYNYASVNGDPWLTFSQIFGPSYAILTSMTSKPLMIGETGSAGGGAEKAAWIRDMGHALATEFTRVRAVVWFQRVKETDWRINSSPQSLAAFRALATSRQFQAPTG